VEINTIHISESLVNFNTGRLHCSVFFINLYWLKTRCDPVIGRLAVFVGLLLWAHAALLCVLQAAAPSGSSPARRWSTAPSCWASRRRTWGSASPPRSCSRQQGAPKARSSSKTHTHTYIYTHTSSLEGWTCWNLLSISSTICLLVQRGSFSSQSRVFSSSWLRWKSFLQQLSFLHPSGGAATSHSGVEATRR